MNVEKNDNEKCHVDPLIIELSSRTLNICFAGCPHAKEFERRQTFLDGCFVRNRLQIVVSNNGLNFDLQIFNVNSINKEEITFESILLLNGINTHWKARMNQNTLTGSANLSFDFVQLDDLEQLSNKTNNNLLFEVKKLRENILKH